MNISNYKLFPRFTPTFGNTSKKNTNDSIKFKFSETEEVFNENMTKLYRLERDIRVQKQNLKTFYSAQDKYDYQELLKQKRQVVSKMNRIAKKAGKDVNDFEIHILIKKQINKYIPKILNAKNKEELMQLKELVSTTAFFQLARDVLCRIIERKKI